MAKKSASKNLAASIPQPSNDYETDDHLRTLERASDILDDHEKLKKVHKLAGRRHKAVSKMVEPHMKAKKKFKSLDDLKSYANKAEEDRE